MSAPDQLRQTFEERGLELDQLDVDPMVEFDRWFKMAEESRPGRWYEANAMTLSTCGADPSTISSRTVLLKGYDAGRLVFYTNYQSHKGRQLDENPHASLLLHWHYLGRQIRVTGTVIKTDREDSERYFHSRSRASQLSALASDQSTPLPHRKLFEQRVRELDKQYEGQPVPLPDHWGGYELRPVEFEFWQGRSNRMHDRFLYRWVELPDGWRWDIQRLYP